MSVRVLMFLVLLVLSGAVAAAELTVSAAASLTNAFKDIAQRYEAAYPRTKVLLNFGASGALLQQIAKGAPVDVFASADQETMDRAVKAQRVASQDRRDFVRNALVLIAPTDSKLLLTKLGDLTRPDVKKVAIGVPVSVPVGRYTQQALEAAKLWTAMQAKTVNTQNVRQSLDYVARGEVDAGFVYATDAAVMKDKVKVVLTVPLTTSIRYPIAKTIHSAQPHEANRFIDFVMSAEGQAILARHGFLKP